MTKFDTIITMYNLWWRNVHRMLSVSSSLPCTNKLVTPLPVLLISNHNEIHTSSTVSPENLTLYPGECSCIFCFPDVYGRFSNDTWSFLQYPQKHSTAFEQKRSTMLHSLNQPLRQSNCVVNKSSKKQSACVHCCKNSVINLGMENIQ